MEDGQVPGGVGTSGAPTPVSAEELALLDALRAGDEAAFVTLTRRLHPSLVRVARMYVHDSAVAEEVAQETWIGVLRGLATFEPRVSLKTWIFRILVNRAKTSAQREGRSVPFSAALDALGAHDGDDPAVSPDRFLQAATERAPAGWWATPPQSWGAAPEEAALAGETRRYLAQALATLPASQREVITLRDVEGLSAQEVCNILGVSEINQRVLLHRARSKARQALGAYLRQEA